MSLRNLKERYGPWGLVTGASDGIGREMAIRMAEAGLNLILVARRAETLQLLADDLMARYGIEAKALPVDLADTQQVSGLLSSTEAYDIGLFVAAAGFGTSGPFIDQDVVTELEMLDVNCRAVIQICHRLGARFVERKRGGIILFSSIVAFQGVPRAAHYAATKAHIQTFAEGLRRELAPFGVDVLAAAPGPVASGFSGRAGMTMWRALTPQDVGVETLAALGKVGTVRPGYLSKLLEAALSPLPRWGRTRIMALVMAGMTQRK